MLFFWGGGGSTKFYLAGLGQPAGGCARGDVGLELTGLYGPVNPSPTSPFILPVP